MLARQSGASGGSYVKECKDVVSFYVQLIDSILSIDFLNLTKIDLSI